MSGRSAGRPKRDEELRRVAVLAGVSEDSVRNFFNRPGRLSQQLRQQIASAVADTGYKPIRHRSGSLRGVSVGYQMPRAWSRPSPVMATQLTHLVHAAQEAGGQLIPFEVDPRVPGVNDVVGGTFDDRAEPSLGLLGWQRVYANNLAVHVYRDMLREKGVKAFVVPDLFVDDPRLAMLKAEGIPHVALGLPRSSTSSPGHHFVETDNFQAIATMVEKLREVGCQTFGHLGFTDDGSHVVRDRREAVLAAVGEDVPAERISYIDSATNPHSPNHIARLREWIDETNVDAVICDSDALAFMVHLAAPGAGRSNVQDPENLRRNRDRTLMLAGNDNDVLRNAAVARDQRWMTLQAPEPEKMRAAIQLLAKLRNGEPAEQAVMIAPEIIGWMAESAMTG